MTDRIRFWRRAALVAAIVAIAATLAPPHSSAQALYGSIVGTVGDQSGAPIPGATVTATNTGTNSSVDTQTDGSGTYTFRNLLPGTYNLRASLQGFRELTRTGLRVTAGNPIRQDLSLEVGALAEAVTVTAETTLLQTEKADLSTELSSKEIVNLPLNQFRNYQKLLDLVPGATPAQFQNAEIDTPGRALSTSVNGTQRNSNGYRIDGAVSVNLWLPHHVGYVNSAETIETVNISTNNFAADQGMAAGAAVTVVTKSGT
ncbi:MAG TPA: carboxypeptidase-like regulatory domain-containing protein, partial [Vicinamibacteria bacterium]|nr:carboxypeptidase-like regulatory domain-containing protein [Vicinamibacteria bacterium]